MSYYKNQMLEYLLVDSSLKFSARLVIGELSPQVGEGSTECAAISPVWDMLGLVSEVVVVTFSFKFRFIDFSGCLDILTLA